MTARTPGIIRWIFEDRKVVDISMCEGGECPKKQDCGRFRAKPDERRQSYVINHPGLRGEFCGMFWPLERFPYRLAEDAKGTSASSSSTGSAQ